jgi:hypothetical protein
MVAPFATEASVKRNIISRVFKNATKAALRLSPRSITKEEAFDKKNMHRYVSPSKAHFQARTPIQDPSRQTPSLRAQNPKQAAQDQNPASEHSAQKAYPKDKPEEKGENFPEARWDPLVEREV